MTIATVKETKNVAEGGQVTFCARVLRSWEVGSLKMVLVGDATGLTRVETGDETLESGRSYVFRNATVRQYPGGWTSISIAAGGKAVPLLHDIDVPQDEAYIERTFKILSGIQRKKGRKDCRLPVWQHPAKEADE